MPSRLAKQSSTLFRRKHGLRPDQICWGFSENFLTNAKKIPALPSSLPMAQRRCVPRPPHGWGYWTILRHTALDRIPLGELSARRRDFWLHTTLITDRHSCLRRDSNPQSQRASGRIPMPYTARSLRSAKYQVIALKQTVTATCTLLSMHDADTKYYVHSPKSCYSANHSEQKLKSSVTEIIFFILKVLIFR